MSYKNILWKLLISIKWQTLRKVYRVLNCAVLQMSLSKVKITSL